MSRPPCNNMIFGILFTTLSIIRIACAADPPAKTTSVKLTPSHVAVSQSAEIFCSYTSIKEPETFKMLLLKGREERLGVCSYFKNETFENDESKNNFNCNANFTKEEKRVTFRLQNLHINQTDIYFCKFEAQYPPPYYASESQNGTLIHVKGVPECHCHQHGLEYTLMMVAIGIFIFYGVLITAACYYCWRKAEKNKVYRNDYFNMTPWQSNGAKKRQPHLSVPVRNYTAYRSWEP